MKKLSIRLRVTLWFTLLMTLLVAVVLAFLLSASGRMLRATSEKDLIFSVENIEEASLETNRPEEHVGENAFVRKGVYLSVYDTGGNFLYGVIPTGFDNSVSFSSGQMQTADNNGVSWTVYDIETTLPEYGEVWVRGVKPAGDSQDAIASMLHLARIALPFFVVVAALGGYFLTSRAFRPVKQITALAENIGDGKDLSKRIRLGEGKDEIYTLANTFDSMFDRLENSFDREKQFTSDASHELRTPTSVIISQCEYALENAQTLEEAKSSLDVILKHAQKMSSLISQLLVLARADKGQQKLNIEPVNLSELCALVAEEMQDMADEKTIIIHTALEPDLKINGDETMLMRMLINLVSNAITYGRTGGMVEITLQHEDGGLVGHVRDDGSGIAPADIDKIWERFYQADPSRASNSEGVGLGLSMVKWIAEAHGGRVSVRSELNKGSDFSFVLPV
ncbi:MAG: sensor histidine kinase [Oscillospiraceae bacterium]